MRNTPAALITLLALSACAGPADTTPVTGAAQAATPHSTAAPCLTSGLDSTIELQPAVATPTRRSALITLTNTGGSACTLNGWLTITLVNSARTVVTVPTVKVDKPAQARELELSPGRAAFAGLQWTYCEKSDPGCLVAANLRYDVGLSPDGPTATLEGFPTPKRSRITMTALEIGTLQPTATQALNW